MSSHTVQKEENPSKEEVIYNIIFEKEGINDALLSAIGSEMYQDIVSFCGVGATGGFSEHHALYHVASERTFAFIQATGNTFGFDKKEFTKKETVLPCSKTLAK